MAVYVANMSHTGMVRAVNEDYYGYFHLANYDILVIADGMGGHRGGKIASKIAVDAVREYFETHLKDGRPIESMIDEAFGVANRMIRDFASANPGLYGMGATAICLVVENNKAFYRHLGDCRLYLIRDEKIKRLTKDHTLVQKLLDDGIITLAESFFHPERNIVSKALGGRFYLEFDEPIGFLEMVNGDRLLMCSDGLFDSISDEEILELAKHGDIQNCVQELINEANRRGGNDNITVQILLYAGE
ncbi:MAG: Stp1/IreP family PP2C-type Ser/Thr phosphatase [Deltaproteobacteria bacterium]|nr:Stp1/IreP family PP2C-type Ser/Thr phosphatase [Deltaproteobacteria bacterium]